jgi:hypothetical protein
MKCYDIFCSIISKLKKVHYLLSFYMRFEKVTAIAVKITFFLGMAPCSLVDKKCTDSNCEGHCLLGCGAVQLGKCPIFRVKEWAEGGENMDMGKERTRTRSLSRPVGGIRILVMFQEPLRSYHSSDSRWLPTAEARPRTRSRSCGICGGQSGQLFHRLLHTQ